MFCCFYCLHPKDDGRLCFHRCVSVQLSGWGGVPHPGNEERYCIPGPDRGGVPHSRSRCRVAPYQVWTGEYPILPDGEGTPCPDQVSGQDREYPIQLMGVGVPHPRSGQRYPIIMVPHQEGWMGTPIQDWHFFVWTSSLNGCIQ